MLEQPVCIETQSSPVSTENPRIRARIKEIEKGTERGRETCSNIRVKDFNILGVLEMDSVSVWAVFRCRDCHIFHLHSLRVIEFEVAQGAVYDTYIVHFYIIAFVESHSLLFNQHRTMYVKKWCMDCVFTCNQFLQLV